MKASLVRSNGKAHIVRFPWLTTCGKVIDDSYLPASNVPLSDVCGVCLKHHHPIQQTNIVYMEHGITVSLFRSSFDLRVVSPGSADRVVDISLRGQNRNDALDFAKEVTKQKDNLVYMVGVEFDGLQPENTPFLPLDFVPNIGFNFLITATDGQKLFAVGSLPLIVDASRLAIVVSARQLPYIRMAIPASP